MASAPNRMLSEELAQRIVEHHERALNVGRRRSDEPPLEVLVSALVLAPLPQNRGGRDVSAHERVTRHFLPVHPTQEQHRV